MMRKIVKHGPSSYIVSLPLAWVKKFSLAKGDEINVEQKGNYIVLSTSQQDSYGKVDIDISTTKGITSEIIESMYKRGVEEVRIIYSRQEDFRMIVEAVERDAIGYEIISTTKSSCTLKSITKLTNEFDNVLRRVFLVTISLAEEGLKTIQEKNYDSLANITILEKSNNKLTTFCRRYLNKYDSENFDRIGPLYFIVETLEKIADEYRYLYDDIAKPDDAGAEPSKHLLSCFETLNEMLRAFYECFYKLDYAKINRIKSMRKELISAFEKESSTIKGRADLHLYHHGMSLAEKIYSLVDPYLIITIKEQKQ